MKLNKNEFICLSMINWILFRQENASAKSIKARCRISNDVSPHGCGKRSQHALSCKSPSTKKSGRRVHLWSSSAQVEKVRVAYCTVPWACRSRRGRVESWKQLLSGAATAVEAYFGTDFIHHHFINIAKIIKCLTSDSSRSRMYQK